MGTTTKHLLSQEKRDLLFITSSKIAATAVILLGLLVILGWQQNIPILTTAGTGSIAMKPFTACCFLLAGLSLLNFTNITAPNNFKSKFIQPTLGILLLLISGSALVQYIFSIELGIDGLLYNEKIGRLANGAVPRMSFFTALAFFLLGSAVLYDNRHIGSLLPAQLNALVATIIGFVGSVGYLYGMENLYGDSYFNSMAVHTAVGLIPLGLGFIFARPRLGAMLTLNSEYYGGWLARRLLPIAAIVPIIFGYLRLIGQQKGYYGPEFGLALFASSNVAVFTLVIWCSAKYLNKVDKNRAEITKQDLFLAAIVNSTDDAIIGKTTEGIITSWNKGAEYLFGYTADEIIGKPKSILFPENKLSESRRILREINAGRSVVYPSAIRRKKNGTLVQVTLTVSPVRTENGEILGASTIARDITSQKQGEESIRIAQLRLDGILDSAMDAIITIDAEQHIILFNKAAEKMFKCEASTARGQLIELFIPQRFRSAHGQHIKNFGATGTTSRKMASLGSLSGLRSNGEEFPIEASISQVDVGGTKLFTVILRDITERHRSEEVLRQTQKMQALGTLAGGIAHDFNNILSVIMGNLVVATSELSIDHPIHKYLTQIDKASTRASGLVRQILGFSRPQLNTREVIALQPIVNEAIEFLKVTLPPQVQFKTLIGENIPSISADISQIHQIIMNLGTNAMQAMGEKGGLIEIRIDLVDVDDSFVKASIVLPHGRYVRLIITDNGSGIEKENLERIFEPFFTTKVQERGTGLGLSVVHGIMRSHNGSITAYSEVGKGTSFHLYFPAVEEIKIGTKSFRQELVTGKGKRVLYIEDEEQISSLAKLLLERLGFVVTVYLLPKEALAHFKQSPYNFDVVVTDLSMPGMSGVELVSQILAIRPKMPVIMTSGYFRPEDDELASKLGVRALLLKPGAINEMGLTLNRVLQEDTEK